jgi:peptide/nickel transport system permease protein
MIGYIGRRLLQLPLLLLFTSLIVFSLMHIAPGDPVPLMIGDVPSPESEAALRHELGLDRPLPVQFLTWLGNALRGNLGFSVATKRSIGKELTQRLPNTFLLAVTAMVWAVAIGIPVGIIAAVRQNTWIDHLLMTLALGGISIPSFSLAIFLILILAVALDMLPISGWVSLGEDPMGALRLLILPALALGARAAGIIARMLRSSMIEVLNEDYIVTARGKGLSSRRIYWHHGLKNAFIPTLTVLGISFAYMLGGSVVIEHIFSIPGIGSYLILGVFSRDYPVIQGVSLCVAVIFIAINLVTDILYSYVDPRIRCN